MISARRLFVASAFLSLPLALVAQDIASWAAPPYWSPPATIRTPEKVDSDVARVGVESIEAVPTPPLALTGINPCRIVDTRGNGFTGAYGPPALTQGSPRNFTLSGQCGISGAAQAVSLNITVTNTQGPGFILIYPQGGAQPTVSTLNYVAGQTVANAAVVPLGTAGGVTVIAGVSGTDLIIDTNGYYAPQAVVNTVNGLSGAVTLAAGSNVSITPSGQTLTIASNGGPGGLLPAGSFGQTLRHDGISWVASNALRNDGTDISVSGVLRFPATVRATAGLSLLFHNTGGDPNSPNTFFGIGAGNLSTTSTANVAFGGNALQLVTIGPANTAIGFDALQNDQTGGGNTAVGVSALRSNTSGGFNTAYGYLALDNITTITSGSASTRGTASRPAATTCTWATRASRANPTRSGLGLAWPRPTHACSSPASSTARLRALRSSSAAPGNWESLLPPPATRKTSGTWATRAICSSNSAP